LTYLDSKKLQGVDCVVNRRSFLIIGFIDNGQTISSKELLERVERDFGNFTVDFKDYNLHFRKPRKSQKDVIQVLTPVVTDKPRRAKPSDLGLEKPPGKYQRRKESKFKYAGGARGSSGAKVKL
jgi:hypothetical protein